MTSRPSGSEDTQHSPSEPDPAASLAARRGTQANASTSPDQQRSSAADPHLLLPVVDDNTALSMACQTSSNLLQEHLQHLLAIDDDNFDDNASTSSLESGEIREFSHLDNMLYKEGKAAYHTAPEDPPVTLESLEELEFPRICSNPKLRYDVNFDRELHFRPDVEGSRGKNKIEHSKVFYKALEYELIYIAKIQEKRTQNSDLAIDRALKVDVSDISKRLPKVLDSTRDILVSLVPEREQDSIKNHLDVDFIMQQVVNGVCDLAAIGNWLNGVIKSHCAPMRDDAVDKMKNTIDIAISTQDNSQLTDGLRQILDLMEAMKLDVANHHIRTIRGVLIKTTVEFIQQYNEYYIQRGKCDTDSALAWLQDELDRPQHNAIPDTPLHAVTSAVLWDVVSPQGDAPYSATFYLDFERLKKLSTEMSNEINQQICLQSLDKCLPPAADIEYRTEAAERFSECLVAIMENQDWQETEFDNIVAEMIAIAGSTPGARILYPSKFERNVRNRLRRDLFTQGPCHAREKTVLYDRLIPKLHENVQKYRKLQPLELHNHFVPPIIRNTRPIHGFGAILTPPVPTTPIDPDAKMVDRLTHIVCLHWLVWGDFYLSGTDHRYQDDTIFYAPLSIVNDTLWYAAPVEQDSLVDNTDTLRYESETEEHETRDRF